MSAKQPFASKPTGEADADAEARASDASEVATFAAQMVGDHKALSARGRRGVAPAAGARPRRGLARTSTSRPPLAPHAAHRTQVLAGQRNFVTTGFYDAECTRRRDQLGESWPMATDLCRQYGHWLKAYEAAQRWWEQGGAARVPGSLRHARGFDQGYRPDVVIAALIRFRRDVGYWPTEWEFELWGRIVRRTAVEDPRIPIPVAVRKAFGRDFELAKAAAQDVFGANG